MGTHSTVGSSKAHMTHEHQHLEQPGFPTSEKHPSSMRLRIRLNQHSGAEGPVAWVDPVALLS